MSGSDHQRGYYERLGGAGITRVLYECLLCGAAVSARDVHDEWHRRQQRERRAARHRTGHPDALQRGRTGAVGT